ncbi:hypothetical protein JDV02_006891 [Purpureocillium takamizusanense]|uniref:Uncharacterized protein n=1 Tax=Purpureocillium takamizusanense TaxID=2060973 RepID=A0A9Q8VD67_9HYPO|nr:uncharacterized protein JDV02_006891 [Purpureocillium takamizusanense]UNI20841.1 hypothetical protein JDV02_006891 [Purpureocillium takamizusanense]
MHHLHAAVLLALGWSVAAFDPAKRNACQSQDYTVCLDSFAWCAGPNDNDNNGCSFPKHTYPYYDRDSGPNKALLLWDQNYTISWKNTDDRFPVQLVWRFVEQIDPPRSGSWSKNITKGAKSFSFTFKDLAAEIQKSSNNNSTVAEIKGYVSDFNNEFEISQPENDFAQGKKFRTDHSDPFAVLDSTAAQYLETHAQIASRETEHKWKLGVGIGVGLGVTILLVLSVAAGWRLGRRGGVMPAPKVITPRPSVG